MARRGLCATAAPNGHPTARLVRSPAPSDRSLRPRRALAQDHYATACTNNNPDRNKPCGRRGPVRWRSLGGPLFRVYAVFRATLRPSERSRQESRLCGEPSHLRYFPLADLAPLQEPRLLLISYPPVRG